MAMEIGKSIENSYLSFKLVKSNWKWNNDFVSLEKEIKEVPNVIYLLALIYHI